MFSITRIKLRVVILLLFIVISFYDLSQTSRKNQVMPKKYRISQLLLQKINIYFEISNLKFLCGLKCKNILHGVYVFLRKRRENVISTKSELFTSVPIGVQRQSLYHTRIDPIHCKYQSMSPGPEFLNKININIIRK